MSREKWQPTPEELAALRAIHGVQEDIGKPADLDEPFDVDANDGRVRVVPISDKGKRKGGASLG